MMLKRGKFPSLSVCVDPSDEGGLIYTISVKNTGGEVLNNVLIIYGPLLHPGNFGLDDTHMPENIWVKAPVLIPQIAPNETATFNAEGYDVPEKYDGLVRTTVAVDFPDLAEHSKFSGHYSVEAVVNLPNARKNLWRAR
jgi:hypothetical protein